MTIDSLIGEKIDCIARTERAMQGWHDAARTGHTVRRDVGDAGIGTGNFTQGVPAFWFARSIEYGFSENLYYPYADSPYVRDAIRKIAQPISSCEVLFSRPGAAKVRQFKPGMKRLSTARGILYRDPAELLELPQLMTWMREPMADMTWQDFVEASIGWYKMQECFWTVADGSQSKVPFPEVSGRPLPLLKLLNPGNMRPVIEDDEVIEWSYMRRGKSQTFEPDQVIRLRGWNPYDEFRGLGDYRAVHLAAEADWLAGKFSRNLMANNGDTSRIIAVKGGTPSDTQRQQLLMEFKARREASLRGQNRDVVVGGDVELHNAELASVDAGYISQRLENRHEIFIGFGVPPSMADIKASYSIGSASDMFQLLINTCIPTGAKFCAALEKLIFRLTGDLVEAGLNWDEHPCMQEVRKERLAAIAQLAAQGMPMQEINEYLALGLVEFPGWEIGYIPINVSPVLDEEGGVKPAPMPGDFSEPGDDADGTLSDEPQNGSGADADQPEAVKEMLLVLRGRPAFKGSEENKKLWESHMRLRSKSVKRFEGKLGKVLAEYRVKALKNLSSALAHQKSLTDVIFDTPSFMRDLMDSLDPAQRAALEDAVKELHDEIGTPDDPWTMPSADVLEAIRISDNNISGVGDTVYERIKKQMDEGVQNGESAEKLARRVKDVFNTLQNGEVVDGAKTLSWMRMAAMNLTGDAYSQARNAAMLAAGITHKSWLSNHGPHVRPAHRAAEFEYGAPAKAIPITDMFIVGGEPLLYPRYFTGSPGNVINCHCIQLARKDPGA